MVVVTGKTEPLRKNEEVASKTLPKMELQHSRSRDFKCFKCLGSGHIASQCPNKRSIILSVNEKVVSNSSGGGMPELEEASSGEVVEHAVEGIALVVKRALNTQIKANE